MLTSLSSSLSNRFWSHIQAEELKNQLKGAFDTASRIPWSDCQLKTGHSYAPGSGKSLAPPVLLLLLVNRKKSLFIPCLCLWSLLVSLLFLPLHTYTHRTHTAPDSSASEATSIQLEFKYLAYLLNDKELYRKAQESTEAFEQSRQSLGWGPGMYVCKHARRGRGLRAPS